MMAAKMVPTEMVSAEMMAAVVSKAEWHINWRQIDVGIEAVPIPSVAAGRMMPVTMPADMSLLHVSFAQSETLANRRDSSRQSRRRRQVD